MAIPHEVRYVDEDHDNITPLWHPKEAFRQRCILELKAFDNSVQSFANQFAPASTVVSRDWLVFGLNATKEHEKPRTTVDRIISISK